VLFSPEISFIQVPKHVTDYFIEKEIFTSDFKDYYFDIDCNKINEMTIELKIAKNVYRIDEKTLVRRIDADPRNLKSGAKCYANIGITPYSPYEDSIVWSIGTAFFQNWCVSYNFNDHIVGLSKHKSNII
jgi:hypothetical protein